MRIFQDLNEKQGITVIFVTHEPEIAQHTRRIIRLRDGLVISDAPVKNPKRAGERAYERTADALLNHNHDRAAVPEAANEPEANDVTIPDEVPEEIAS
jgi:ABC-type phosphate/phosphonate transport system ATPase subunit